MIAGCAAMARAQGDPGQVAYSLEHQGKLAEAEQAWATIAKQHPRDAQPLAHMGLIESKQEHYKEAIALYRRALALNPTMPGLKLNLGLAYFKAEQYREALSELEPMSKAQPDDQRLTVLVGMSHYGLKEFSSAVPFLKKAAEQDPQNGNLLLTLAHSCLLSTQYPCVLDAYHQLVAMNAESAEADMLVGEALDEMKDPEGAIREFRSAVAANPKEPNVHFGLGYLLWTRAQYTEAAPELQAELENDPHHLPAMLYLADTFIQTNRMDEAQPLLEKLVELNSRREMAHRDLGIVYAEKDRKPDALKEFQKALALTPDDVNVHWRLGRLYRSMGEQVKAKAEFAKAGSLNKAADEKLLKVMSMVPAKSKSPEEK